METCRGYDLLPGLVFIIERHCVFCKVNAEAEKTVEH
jgi:hypothetical protein